MIPDSMTLFGQHWLWLVRLALAEQLDTSTLIFSWETACLCQMSYWKFKLTQVCFNLCDKEADNKLNMFMLRKTIFQWYPFLWFCIFHVILVLYFFKLYGSERPADFFFCWYKNPLYRPFVFGNSLITSQ